MKTIGFLLVVGGGILFFIHSLSGLRFIFLMDISSARDLLFIASLCGAFPTYLLAFASLRITVVALWIFAVFQWLVSSFAYGYFKPVSPVDGLLGVSLLIGVILVHVGYSLLAEGSQKIWRVRLSDET